MVEKTPLALANRQRMRALGSIFSDALVSLLFPAGCRLCEELLARATRIPICDQCFESFARVPQTACEICGMPLLDGTTEAGDGICRICQDKTYAFARARSYVMYEGAAIQAILLLKFERMEPLAKWFAGRLAEVLQRAGEAMEADIVVPVPLHRQRERERGYNQAEMVAKPLAKLLKLPLKPVLLTRTKPRPDKHVLSLEERWESVRGAFATRTGSQVDNLCVLLVDDVLTTGATLDACARVLRDAGAKSVVGVTIARTARQPIRSLRKS